MGERGSRGRVDGLCWAALVTGLTVTASAVHAALSTWAVIAAQQFHTALAGGWGGVVLAGR